jgi:light-regulated signal transduction histidine kinase (bacteriophytochrome)
LNVRGKDEIAQACDAFNRMTAERAKAEEKIMNFTATLEKRVEMRTEELTRAKNELEAFTYAVSHDLQAPVRHVLSFSQILLDDYRVDLPEGGHDCLLRINKSGRHMRELITHLLDLSRLNQQELNRVETDLGSISRNICQELAANDPSRQVDVEIADGLVSYCDPNLVAIVMENLLGNAWKYTRNVANPRIEVVATVHEGIRCFFVKDNGSGFDMAYANRLFTPFQRLHSADEFEGTGVGLATVMRIIQRHEGSIWAESSPGEGAAFYFTLNHEA